MLNLCYLCFMILKRKKGLKYCLQLSTVELNSFVWKIE